MTYDRARAYATVALLELLPRLDRRVVYYLANRIAVGDRDLDFLRVMVADWWIDHSETEKGVARGFEIYGEMPDGARDYP